MSEQQIPAGWYPDPVDTDSDPRPERWWDGKGWTASTRPAPAAPAATPADAYTGASTDAPAGPPGGTPADAVPPASDTEETTVLEGTVLDASGQAVQYPPLPPYAEQPSAKQRRGPSKPVVIAASVAALLGLAVGSGVTYLAMDGHSDTSAAAKPSSQGRHGYNGNPGDGSGGQNGGGSGSGGNGSSGGNGKGNGSGNGLPGFPGFPGQGGGNGPGGGKGGGASANLAVDAVNGVSVPVPDGWTGGTTTDGFASALVGEYTCVDGSDSCSLGGVNTSKISGSDAKQAAQQDIAAAAKDSYGDITGHQELKNEAVTVAGRAGWLVRWQVDAPKGNNGYVETVVFPAANGKALVAVHLGFDIADKAPGVDQMDTIVKGIADFQGATGTGPGTTT
ncbi:DUF2510 domain-containing protein [Kitasatospora sp. NPDC092948]|uniref:DUF2510 domain-containing protein n=1 Tax=Kitasatospora sp. NPDC092948 TaxID=3364088 RepID=UPI0037F88791